MRSGWERLTTRNSRNEAQDCNARMKATCRETSDGNAPKDADILAAPQFQLATLSDYAKEPLTAQWVLLLILPLLGPSSSFRSRCGSHALNRRTLHGVAAKLRAPHM